MCHSRLPRRSVAYRNLGRNANPPWAEQKVGNGGEKNGDQLKASDDSCSACKLVLT